MSKKRYTHSLNVAMEAVRLADRYGADRDNAYVAGLLHDNAKELPIEQQRALVLGSAREVCEIEQHTPALFHAVAGAELAASDFHIENPDILSAIRYHTIARDGMSLLEQILYLADLISIDRDYKDVKRMRKLAFVDLDLAMYEALKFSVADSVARMNTIPPQTMAAYNQYTALAVKAGLKPKLKGRSR